MVEKVDEENKHSVNKDDESSQSDDLGTPPDLSPERIGLNKL